MKTASGNACKCPRLSLTRPTNMSLMSTFTCEALNLGLGIERTDSETREALASTKLTVQQTRQPRNTHTRITPPAPHTEAINARRLFLLRVKTGLGAQHSFNCTDYQLNLIQSRRIWWCWYVFPDEIQFWNSEAIASNLHFIKTQMNWEVNNLSLTISKIYYYW